MQKISHRGVYPGQQRVATSAGEERAVGIGVGGGQVVRNGGDALTRDLRAAGIIEVDDRLAGLLQRE